MHKNSFTIKQITKSKRYYQLFITGFSTFLFSFLSASVLAPIENSSADQQVLASIAEGDYSVSVSGSSSINLDLGQPTLSGKIVSASDELSIIANAPLGYKLYVSMDNANASGNRLYKNGDDTSAFFEPNKDATGIDVAFTSPTSLADNSWGYTTDSVAFSNDQYSAMPLNNSMQLISQSDEPGTYTQDIYYGVKANTLMIGGNYSGNIVYTVTSDSIVDNTGIKSITPNYNLGISPTNVQITVDLFSGATNVEDFGTITTTVGGSTCSDPTHQLSDDTLIISCIVPTFTTSGTKDVSVSIQRYGQTYTLQNAFTYKIYMQEFTATDCVNLTESTTSEDHRIALKDIRDNKEYQISKLADGNCWMVQNLALDGTTDGSTPRTLTTSDSDIDTSEIPSGSYIFPSGVDIAVGTPSSDATPQIITAYQDNTMTNGNIYGNLYNWMAVTAGQGNNTLTYTDVSSSVCPKNWQLPSAYTTPNYDNLLTQYQITNANVWEKATSAPLYFAAAGRYLNTKVDTGVGHHQTSSAATKETHAYSFSFTSSQYAARGEGVKHGGTSVRCVLKD